jgi:hypothetical protein
MLESHVVGSHQVVVQVLAHFTIDPGSTEETGSFSFLLADDLATADAIVDEAVESGLAVADLPACHQILCDVASDLDGALGGASPHFLVLQVGLSLHLLHLLLVGSGTFDPFLEIFDELLGLLEREVQEAGEFVIDGGRILFEQVVDHLVEFVVFEDP